MTDTLGRLFDSEPHSWALRGDPELWRAMRVRFDATPLPRTSAELIQLLGAAFAEITGTRLADAEGVLWVPSLATTGMSAGGVTPELWRDRLIPALRRRWVLANARRIGSGIVRGA